MNIFLSESREFKNEVRKMQEATEAAGREIKEINRIAKNRGISPKYVRLNEENTRVDTYKI